MASTHKIDDQKELYFVTFTVVEWVDVFTRDCYREIFINSIKFCQKNKSLEVGAWVLMTNHAHLIVRAGGKTRLEAIIRDMKSHTSRAIRLLLENSSIESRKEWMNSIFKKNGLENKKNYDHQLWIQDYHPIKLANTTMLLQKLKYIHDNPVRAGFVTEPQHWKHSSAYDYCGGKQGLIDLIMLV